jgi:hypothetical protein
MKLRKILIAIITVLFGCIGDGIIIALAFSADSKIQPLAAIFGLIVVTFGAAAGVIYALKG